MADFPNMAAARNAMAGWQTPIDTRPFAGANSKHPEVRCRDILCEASSILSMLTAACFDARAVIDRGGTSEFVAMEPRVFATALNGVGTLVDLASFLMED